MLETLRTLPLALTILAALTRPASAAEKTDGADVARLVSDPAALVTWLENRSHEVDAARARVAQARADVGTASLIPNPSVNLSLSDITVGETNPAGLGLGDTAIYSVGLSETVELGKRGPRTASARARLAARHEGYLDTFAGTVADARLALGRVAYLGSRLRALEGSLEDARRVLEIEKSRVDHGDLSANDYDRLVLETLGLEAEAAKSRSEFESARSTCSALLRAECSLGETDHPVEFGTLVQAIEVSGAVDPTRLDQRPDVRSIELDRSSAEQDAVLASRRLIPDPNLGVSYTRDKLVISGDQPKTLGITLGFAIPLFDRGQHDEERATARAAELERTRNGLVAKARSDLASLADRRTRLERAHESLTKEALPRSASVLETTVKAFNLGQVSMTDLLLAQRGHTALQLSVLDLGFDVFTTRSELRRALGADADLLRARAPAPEAP